ncbi:uncharacterized protein METZ01_LOCUS116007 [marine metagenome]|uniref:Uncharacterized protein n=1 Tax=marine metagenome TaxID=408172 RepID=A0A381XFV4_9ZZZZ
MSFCYNKVWFVLLGKSLVFVGLLTVIGIGLYFWISKKLKNRLDQHPLL